MSITIEEINAQLTKLVAGLTSQIDRLEAQCGELVTRYNRDIEALVQERDALKAENERLRAETTTSTNVNHERDIATLELLQVMIDNNQIVNLRQGDIIYRNYGDYYIIAHLHTNGMIDIRDTGGYGIRETVFPVKVNGVFVYTGISAHFSASKPDTEIDVCNSCDEG